MKFFVAIHLFALILAFLVAPGRGRTGEGSQPLPLDKAFELALQYDLTGRLEYLDSALTIYDEFLVPSKIVAKEREYEAIDWYMKAETELRRDLHYMRSTPENEKLRKKAMGHTEDLWSNFIDWLEKTPDLAIRDSISEERARFSRAFKIMASSMVEMGRLVEYSGSLAPLIKNLLGRAAGYGFLEPRIKRQEYLLFLKEFLQVDYPNMGFLSNIIEAWVQEADSLRNPRIFVPEDYRKRKELANFALAAAEAAKRPEAKAAAYYLTAWNSEWDSTERGSEQACYFFNKAVEQFGNFDHFNFGYLKLKNRFNKKFISSQYVSYIQIYGTRLEEQEKYERYVKLLESGLDLEGISDAERCTLARILVEVFSKLITKYRDQGKHDIADEYLQKQQKINVITKGCAKI